MENKVKLMYTSAELDAAVKYGMGYVAGKHNLVIAKKERNEVGRSFKKQCDLYIKNGRKK